MPLFYLDASGIVKRYRSEIGTDAVDELFGRALPTDRWYTSFLSVLEVTSAFRRLAAAHQIPEELAAAALAQFGRDTQELFGLWPLNNEVVAQAVIAASRYLLRSGDAIHLATALLIQPLAVGAQTVMVTADGELAAAARSAGLAVLDPTALDALPKLRELRQG